MVQIYSISLLNGNRKERKDKNFTLAIILSQKHRFNHDNRKKKFKEFEFEKHLYYYLHFTLFWFERTLIKVDMLKNWKGFL